MPHITQLRIPHNQLQHPPRGIVNCIVIGNAPVAFILFKFGYAEGNTVQHHLWFKAGEDNSSGILGLGALHALAQGDGRKIKDGGFFADGAAIGNTAKGIHLQIHIIKKPKRFMKNN